VLASKVARQHAGLSEVRCVLEDGLLYNKTSLLIWSQVIVQDIENKNFARARPLLEWARPKIDKSADLLHQEV
jgi:hypothetical protein